MAEIPISLTIDFCEAKAKECLHLALHASSKSHRIMLESIAETWFRIAENLPVNNAGNP